MNIARFLRSGAILVTLVGAAGCSSPPPPRAAARPAPKPPAVEPWPVITLPPAQDPAPTVADCRAGDARACARAAQLYYDGWGLARDLGRVEMYAAIACEARIAEACTLRALVHLGDEHADAPPGIQALKTYLESTIVGPEGSSILCIELPSRDRWGWAAYQNSDCYGAHASASNEPSPFPEGEERHKTYAACFDEGDPEACRGIAMTTNPDDDLYRKFARICRTKGAACDVALGDTPQETARFHLQACLERSYYACSRLAELAKDAGAPLDPLSVDRLQAQLCLHPEINFRPLSVGEANPEEKGPTYECRPVEFKALAASADAGDKALLRALVHMPEEVRAADCTGRLYDFGTCYLFAMLWDNLSGPREDGIPDELRWKERLEVTAHLCGSPPPYEANKAQMEHFCAHDRKQIEREYRVFLAARTQKGGTP